MLGCGSQIAKILLIIFNVVFFLVGAALLAIGIWVIVSPGGIKVFDIMTRAFDDPLLRNAAIVMTAVGAVIMIISIFGWIGACCENTCMLLTYAVLVGLMLLVQLAAGILAVIYYNKIDAWLQDQMEDGLKVYKKQNTRSSAIDAMHVWFTCCGKNGIADWTGPYSVRNNSWSADFPPSCCKLKEQDPLKIYESNFEDPNCGRGAAGSYYTKGCYSELRPWLKKHAVIIAGVAFGLVVFEIIVIVLACCLRSAIIREKEGTV